MSQKGLTARQRVLTGSFQAATMGDTPVRVVNVTAALSACPVNHRGHRHGGQEPAGESGSRVSETLLMQNRWSVGVG